jgi:hypothetical protein
MTRICGTIKILNNKIREGAMLTREEQFPLMVLGLPGWGKTRILEKGFKKSLVLSVPEYIEDDLNVLSVVEGKLTQMVLPKVQDLVDWANANPQVPCLLLLDELPQGSTQVAKILAKWANEREVSGLRLPDNVVIAATGNQRKHQAGAGSALSHLISRFKIYEIAPDVDGWLDWGATTLHEDVLAYIHMKPTASYCWCDNVTEETMAQQYRDAAKDWVPYPNARSWTALSHGLKSDAACTVEDFAAFVGPERASEFQAMRNVKIPTHPDLLEGRADWPSNPMAKWVAAIRCGQMLSPGNSRKTARSLKNINPELTEVALKVAGKVAKNYLWTKYGLKVANGHMALVSCDSNGAYYYPGFSEELLAPGSRYLAMQEAT